MQLRFINLMKAIVFFARLCGEKNRQNFKVCQLSNNQTFNTNTTSTSVIFTYKKGLFSVKNSLFFTKKEALLKIQTAHLRHKSSIFFIKKRTPRHLKAVFPTITDSKNTKIFLSRKNHSYDLILINVNAFLTDTKPILKTEKHII